MDSVLYRAVMEGDIDVVKEYGDQLKVQLTPNNNTVLHVAAQFGQTECLKEILDMCKGSLLCAVNINGETLLHISCARQGNYEIVEALIAEGAKQVVDMDLESGTTKEMLRMTNAEGDTALHQAVRSDNVDVVHILTKEDPDFVHPPNKAEETPLFLAAERGDTATVSKILENCKSPAYTGPNGRTALHAATIENWGIAKNCCIQKIHNWKPSLSKVADVFGWRPLHYAAWYDNVSMVRELLDVDKSVAYLVADNDEKKTALHIAASLGYVGVMKEILLHCPDCWEMNNSRGQNILHIAVAREEEETMKYILTKSFASNLINQKDIDGNTPLHLLAANSSFDKYSLKEHPKVDRKVYNNNNLSAGEINFERLGAPRFQPRNKFILREKPKASGKEDYKEDEQTKKFLSTQLIVATLIATVTFAAGFTIPGGYDGDKGPQQGMAVLARRAAFVTFVLTDTIAMVFSITSVIIHLFAHFYVEFEKQFLHYLASLLLTLAAMGAMVVAFMTGVYAVLAHSLGLAITVCIICCFFFPISFFVIWKAFRTLISV